MWEDFKNAIYRFKGSKLRTILSMLGILIASASVVVITSVGAASTKEVTDSLGSLGLDVLQVQKGFMRKKKAAKSLKFNATFCQNLFDQIDNIKRVWCKNTVSTVISLGATSSQVNCTAVEAGYLEMYGLHTIAGRFPLVTEDYYGDQRIVLCKSVATALFDLLDGDPLEQIIGQNVIVTVDKVSFSFQVVGVVEEVSTGLEDTKNTSYIPMGFYKKKIKPNPSADMVMIQATSSKFCTSVADDVQKFCDEAAGAQYSVFIISQATMISQIREMEGKLNLLLAGVAAISLFVGGIGIMNIMIVTVTERKKEIGIRRALGATRADITRQFLVESATITLLGGALGVVLGLVASISIELARKQAILVDAKSAVVAFVFCIAVGISFGISPARSASRLDPVLALQGE